MYTSGHTVFRPTHGVHRAAVPMQLPRRRLLITEVLAEEGIQDILVNQD